MIGMSKDVCVYILTHNRPNEVLRSLNSVRQQNFPNLKIVISDNSDNEDTLSLLKNIINNDERISYIRRGEECSSGLVAHFNYILATNTSEYFMLFHDDDEMLPNMVNSLYEYLFTHNEISAVGCSGYLNINGKNTTKKMFVSKNIKKMENSGSVVKQYAIGNIAPFPSFMYRRSKIIGAKMDWLKGGKYCDCSFISAIANKGGVVYLPQCYMYYFISPSQDSQHHEFIQYLSLIKFFSTQIEDRSLLLDMRIFNIYNYLRDLQLKTGDVPYKRKALFLFYKYSLFNYFPKYILRLLKFYTK